MSRTPLEFSAAGRSRSRFYPKLSMVWVPSSSGSIWSIFHVVLPMMLHSSSPKEGISGRSLDPGGLNPNTSSQWAHDVPGSYSNSVFTVDNRLNNGARSGGIQMWQRLVSFANNQFPCPPWCAGWHLLVFPVAHHFHVSKICLSHEDTSKETSPSPSPHLLARCRRSSWFPVSLAGPHGERTWV